MSRTSIASKKLGCLIGALTERLVLSYSACLARDAGAVTINYGLFLENVINFVINAIFLYIAIKKCEWRLVTMLPRLHR